MNHSNWPMADNRASQNWTGRTPRTGNWGGDWADDSYEIPFIAWAGVAAVLVVFAVFAFVGAGVFG